LQAGSVAGDAVEQVKTKKLADGFGGQQVKKLGFGLAGSRSLDRSLPQVLPPARARPIAAAGP